MPYRQESLYDAINDAGAYFVAKINSIGDWQQVDFPIKDLTFQVELGTPIMNIRYSGSSDNGEGLQTTNLPRTVRFIFSVLYGYYSVPATATDDSYEYAQLKALEGESNLRKALLEDYTQENRFIDTRFDESAAGDTEDSDGQPFYGNIVLVHFDIH